MRLADQLAAHRLVYTHPAAATPSLIVIDIPWSLAGDGLALGHYYTVVAETPAELAEFDEFLVLDRPQLVAPDLLDRRPTGHEPRTVTLIEYAPCEPGWPWILLCQWPPAFAVHGQSDPEMLARGVYTFEAFRTRDELVTMARTTMATLGGIAVRLMLRPTPNEPRAPAASPPPSTFHISLEPAAGAATPQSGPTTVRTRPTTAPLVQSAISGEATMADTCAANIRIGGQLWQHLYAAFLTAVEADRARLDYGGEWFSEERLPDNEPLQLFGREAIGGSFENVEAFCVVHRLPFIRWCEARAGDWDAERVAYSGEGEPLHFLATDGEEVAITASDIERFETIETLRAFLKSASPILPPFRIEAAVPDDMIDSAEGGSDE